MEQANNATKKWMWQEYLVRAKAIFINSSSSKWSRNMIVIILIIIFIILLYGSVFSALKQETPLPINIERDNPGLDLRVLQAINTRRSERIQRDRPDYLGFARVFILPDKNE